jgi:DNA-directed RNA polymerase specialized sigma subunit|tara:strand:- start:65 stop:190 length:126 start_codon:yes stop_codon:yes gene_type:complete
MNLREIAVREGISYARVKQIQDAALTKLKKRGFDLKQFLYD